MAQSFLHRVSLTSNVSDVPLLRARMIACVLEGIHVHVGHHIVNELK